MWDGASQKLQAHLAEDIRLNYFPSEEKEFYVETRWNPQTLPIEKNQCVGRLDICDKVSGALITSGFLQASEKIEGTLLFKIKRGLVNPLDGIFSCVLWVLIITVGVVIVLFYRGLKKTRE